jgi:hypothetical protein
MTEMIAAGMEILTEAGVSRDRTKEIGSGNEIDGRNITCE